MLGVPHAPVWCLPFHATACRNAELHIDQHGERYNLQQQVHTGGQAQALLQPVRHKREITCHVSRGLT